MAVDIKKNNNKDKRNIRNEIPRALVALENCILVILC